MSPGAGREIAPPSSSPAPIRETQPQINSPTATAHGVEPFNALYDTPPPGTQPLELKRSDRAHKMSACGRDAAVAWSGKPLAGHSQAQPSQPDPDPTESLAATTSHSTSNRQTTKKPVKRPVLRFDDESDDEPPRTRARDTHDQGTNDRSPPPKRPGRASSVARGRGVSTHSVTIDAEAAQSLGKLLGVDPGIATASAINDTIKSLADHQTPQMGSSQRYSQVRGETSTPLPSLNKKGGGYHRNKLLALAHPQPQPLKRSASRTDVGSSKRSRVGSRDDDVEMAIPDAPPLPSFLEHTAASVSSTQHAVVNAFASQREQLHASQTTDRVRFGTGGTPVPQPRGHFFLFPRRAPSPEHHAVSPEPPAVPRKPHILVPGSPSPPPTPNPHRAQLDTEPEIAQSKPVTAQAPRTSTSKPPPRQNLDTATESDSDSKPVLLLRARPKTHANSHHPRHPTIQAPRTTVRKPPPRQNPDTATESDSGSEPVPVLRPKPTATQASRKGAPKPPPLQDPNTATESDTEPEPTLRPKPKKHTNSHPAGPSTIRSSQPGAKPPTRPQQHAPSHRKSSTVSSASHRDAKAILKQLGDILGGDSGDDDHSILDRAIELLRHRQRQHSCTRPSTSSHHQPGPSTSRHAHCPETPDNMSDTGSHPAPRTDRSPSVDTDSDSDIDLTKSGLGRYPGTRGKAASHAMPRLLSTATCKGIYQDQDTYIKWARNAYRRVWADKYPHIPYKDPPFDLLRTIVFRISGLRTDVKKRIRELIMYLFEFTNPGSSVRLMTANQRRFSELYPNTFHCRDLKTDVKQFEHPAFKRAICVAFFWNQNPFAVRDHKEFEVLPLPAVAFVLTIMQDCLREWETGVFRARDNDFKAQRDMFDAHLMSLHEYRKTAPGRLLRFQGKWFRKGMKYAGVRIHKPRQDRQFCQPITWAHTVRPDTPENSEPEFDEDGRLTARAKGKGKEQHQSDDSDSGDDLNM
ncbi:hypothetical protein FRC08_009878 [Ceratobasidium sp. 394]|nr:hypothetical protein FRC08_009878 [Ceratobasidium sp. 394]